MKLMLRQCGLGRTLSTRALREDRAGSARQCSAVQCPHELNALKTARQQRDRSGSVCLQMHAWIRSQSRTLAPELELQRMLLRQFLSETCTNSSAAQLSRGKRASKLHPASTCRTLNTSCAYPSCC